jgi:polar amino acid transport system substrate-binding protein
LNRIAPLIFSLCFSLIWAPARADTAIKLCYEDSSVYPWITGENKGLVISELHMVEKDLNITFEFLRLPWKRCLQEVRLGNIQAAIAASFNKERASWGSYPRNPDASLNQDFRLHTDSFYFYRRIDSPIRWANNTVQNLGTQVIGAQLGYSVAKSLEDSAYPIKYLPNSEDLFKLLEKGLLQIAVLQNHEAMKVMRNNPALEKTVVKEGEAVKIADQYLLFNTSYYLKEEKLVTSIWQAIARARKSKKYQEEESLMLNEELKAKP